MGGSVQKTNIVLYSTSVSNAGLYPTGWSQNNDDIIVDNDASYIPNSSGYTGASGTYKFVFTDLYSDSVLTYSNSLSTVGYTNIRIKFGVYLATNIMYVEYSTDGVSWLPWTNGGTAPATWELATPVSIPGTSNVANLRFRFTVALSGAGTDYYGIDDITILGDRI